MTQATVTKRGLEDSLWSAHTGGAEQRGGTLGFAVTGPSSITSHALPGRLIHTHKELSLLYLTDPASTIYRDENSSIHSLENRQTSTSRWTQERTQQIRHICKGTAI